MQQDENAVVADTLLEFLWGASLGNGNMCTVE